MASFEPRGNSVRAIVRLPGGGKKSSTFDTQQEAENWAASMERKKALGTVTAVSGITVAELFEAYLEAVAANTDSEKWNKLRLIKWANEPIGARKLASIVTHDIDQWIAARLKDNGGRKGGTITPATVNREMNLMSAAFTYAVKSRKWIKVNPCHGAQRPEKGRPRKRPLLTPAEIRAICIATGFDADPALKTIGARTGACFLLALETGMRSGEILRLRPQDYHRDDRFIHVAAIEQGGRKGAKSGRATVDPSRNVPLTSRAIELLDALLASSPKDQPYIVGLNDRQRDANWRKYRDKAGIEELTFHDTKHEACTRLSKFIDVLALSHAIGTKDVRLLRDTYYNNDAQRSAALLPDQLTPIAPALLQEA